jgi:hypothetical protein
MSTIRCQCVACHTVKEFQVTDSQLAAYQSGKGYIQNIFPAMAPADREMLLSHLCEKCFDEMFAEG